MTMRVRIAKTVLGLGISTLTAVPLAAQEDGGLLLTFGISARVESSSNPGLTVPAEPSREQLSSRLTFGLTDTTRTGSVSVLAAGSLSTDNDDETQDGFVDPSLRLSLARFGATSSFEVSAFLREDDLDSLRDFVFDPETGDITDNLLGNGTRRQTGGDLAFSFGEGGPWGGSLSAGLTDTTFSGDTPEVDYRDTYLGGTLRYDLDPATQLTAGLRWSRYDEEGDDPRDTVRPELTLRRDRPAGYASANVFAEDTEDGTRAGLSFGRGWELPASSFAFSIGATRGVTGDISPTGDLTWEKDLPNGSVDISLSHEITSDDDDAETIETTASLGLSHTLSPLSSVRFGLDASDSEETATNETTKNAALSATYTHALPFDWALDAGVTHRVRNEDGSGNADSDIVFLELRRTLDWRP